MKNVCDEIAVETCTEIETSEMREAPKEHAEDEILHGDTECCPPAMPASCQMTLTGD